VKKIATERDKRGCFTAWVLVRFRRRPRRLRREICENWRSNQAREVGRNGEEGQGNRGERNAGEVAVLERAGATGSGAGRFQKRRKGVTVGGRRGT
jgi:hypothetical protein